ncbi:2-hydroxymuconate tautomerase [Rhodoligotrophos ferricapiens]|uniref:2-hydroxymuconate tautomerase n=1 Tax=Rhodoligotrophos ferricapiens TaxID=3069264 RepID=UPI00315D423E
MPVIQITMIEGRTQDQKSAMYREVTDAVQRTLGSPPESVRIIVNEVPRTHFAVAGIAKSESSKT